jgi:hypothetical protein
VSLRVEWHGADDASAREAFAALGAAADPPAAPAPAAGALSIGIARDGPRARARACLWLADGLAGAPGRSGLIGQYESLDGEAGAALLREARGTLAAGDARRVLGPVDGATWRRYRLELPRAADDPDVQPARFGGEPVNPARYVDEFAAAGFVPVARYQSRYEPAPAIRAGEHDAARTRALRRGIRLHALADVPFDELLRAMHELSLESFAGSPYYAPLPFADFAALYAPFRGRVVPELVRLATGADGRLAGYLFGYPDPLALHEGRPTRTVCKTVAAAPRGRGAGVGGLLLEEFRAASVALGCGGILHALMHEDNVSLRMSARYHSVLFKRYALFGWAP